MKFLLTFAIFNSKQILLFPTLPSHFLICITGPVVSGGNVSTGGVAIQGKLRSQYQV